MPTFYKEYGSDTTETIITTPSGLFPVITYLKVDTDDSNDSVTLRNFPSSGTILSLDGNDVIGPGVTATGFLMEDVEITASGNTKVTISYIFNGFRTTGLGNPFGTIDYRGT